MDTDRCLICNRPVDDYDPKPCCSGRDCGCMGMPTEPCLCSKECADALFSGNGKSFEDRRVAAEIELYSEK